MTCAFHVQAFSMGMRVVQVYGMAVAVLDDDLKITKLEIFYGGHFWRLGLYVVLFGIVNACMGLAV